MIMFRKLITLIILSLSCAGLAYGQSGYRYRYWFDTDDGATIEGTSPSAGIHIDADISRLDESLHVINIQVGDSSGWSAPTSRYFIKAATADKQLLTYYWLDEHDNKREQLPASAGKMEIDVTAVPDGFHILHFQAVSGTASAPVSRMFIKLPQTECIGEMTCLCSVDGKPFKQDKVPSEGGIINWKLDVSQLEQGMHQIQVQVITPSGAASDVYNSFFFRTTKPAEINDMKFIYNVDGGKFQEGIGGGSNGVFHFDVDVSSLSDGLHSLHYMMIGDNGNSTVAKTSYFVKTPVGGDGIDSYRYWLNDNTASITTVKLDKHTSPYSLVKLLPVTSEPVRSECFHFEMADGATPTIYAKNDIHFQFIDATTRIAEVHKQFIDYNVSQKVADTTPLAATQTFERPKENGIKWFTFEAEMGDTVAFRSSQATSLHVYAPSGKELYSASADKSISFGGCHTWENGLHYVAVHDVTGSRSNVTLDYMHMDKYDVVEQDVRVVGNGGASTITFKGNGFTELESVMLNGTTAISSDSIACADDATASIRFDFSNASTGIYDAVFKFKDGTKAVNKCLTVETAKPIAIDCDVKYATTYLRSTSNTYTIKLRNNGNMTAYDVNIPIYIYTKELSDLSRVDVTGFDMEAYYRKNMSMLFSESFNSKKSVMGDMRFFVTSSDNDYETGYPALHQATIPISLRPNTTETVKVSIKASSMAFLYVWHPEKWESTNPQQKINSTIRNASSGICAILNERARQCEDNKRLEENGLAPIYDVDCDDIKPTRNCRRRGGGSNPVNSMDPNDIYGYLSEAGSKFISDSVQNVNYRIEFENDTAFATASAHVVEIQNKLDSRHFDLKSFAPTSIKIGDKVELLDGKPNFVKTIDMRPNIDAIVQVEGKYNSNIGTATWLLTSLDPITMEPTDDVVQGFLPINFDGTSGIGEVAYDIALKKGLADGTEIPNRASIIFDSNEPIETPTWINIVDAIAPDSKISEVTQKNDSTVTISFGGTDARSGIWKYEIYAQYGKDSSWDKIATCSADTSCIDFNVYNGIDYGFCVLATDSAGNVEKKPLQREGSFVMVKLGDVNCDGIINTLDASLTIAYYINPATPILTMVADVNCDGKINSLDATQILQMYISDAIKKSKIIIPKRERLKPIKFNR